MRHNFRIGICFLYLFNVNLKAQQDAIFSSGKFGLHIGAHFALGSHFQRLGISLIPFFISDSWQINTEARVYINAKNLGPHLMYTEAVTSIGIVYGFGSKDPFANPFPGITANHTGKKYAIAYAFNAYWNKIRTTQQTGIIALQLNKISFITENDLLARPAFDRFRTGAFLLQYRHKDIAEIGINATLWTGKMGFAVRNDSHYPAAGYMDTTGSVYPDYSHGLLSAQARLNMNYGQSVRVNAGIDSEKVRHLIQNRIIHDACLLPKTWFTRKNCHIPMLDHKNQQFLFKDGQNVKPASFYWNVFSNPSLFY
ncbi:MAG: polymorphic toxin type 23 domain-containing protein [Sediminibacterium sp.]|nr:polymorphic toxin type 23 domain-containing protein [Sediminibacterium sp.]